jgi:5-methylcytosine-specific restriction endonuclease McrA
MGVRQKDWARRKRKELIEQLGGTCAICGRRHDLEFDHINPLDKPFPYRELEWSHRISVYTREIREGKIQLLCSVCNGDKRQHELTQPQLEAVNAEIQCQ